MFEKSFIYATIAIILSVISLIISILQLFGVIPMLKLNSIFI